MGHRYQMERLADGRLYFHDGPIDLIVGIFGSESEIERAVNAAERRFATILDELCTELPALRRRSQPGLAGLRGQVARRMEEAVAPFAAEHFVTPMAAVAGAVAEEVLAAMTSAADLDRAYVNNGGDIALHLSEGASFAIGMVDRPDKPSLFGSFTIRAEDAVRGVATSGWRGRSFSLGVADAVTVLASNASRADAAATIIANAVDLPEHPAIIRIPAKSLDPDSDLSEIPVTQGVGPLTREQVLQALAFGARQAREVVGQGLIDAVALLLNGETCIVGGDARTAALGLAGCSYHVPSQHGSRIHA
jgi:ApbE superfamily uncharacterized protein (UPF0280 family)